METRKYYEKIDPKEDVKENVKSNVCNILLEWDWDDIGDPYPTVDVPDYIPDDTDTTENKWLDPNLDYSDDNFDWPDPKSNDKDQAVYDDN